MVGEGEVGGRRHKDNLAGKLWPAAQHSNPRPNLFSAFQYFSDFVICISRKYNNLGGICCLVVAQNCRFFRFCHLYFLELQQFGRKTMAQNCLNLWYLSYMHLESQEEQFDRMGQIMPSRKIDGKEI